MGNKFKVEFIAQTKMIIEVNAADEEAARKKAWKIYRDCDDNVDIERKEQITEFNEGAFEVVKVEKI